MLVLSRQRDESLMIGSEVKVMVVDIRGDKVRLGVEAPKHVPVHRSEVADAIARHHGPMRTTPVPVQEQLSAERLSAIAQLDLDPHDASKSEAYKAALRDCLRQLALMSQRQEAA